MVEEKEEDTRRGKSRSGGEKRRCEVWWRGRRRKRGGRRRWRWRWRWREEVEGGGWREEGGGRRCESRYLLGEEEVLRWEKRGFSA